MHEIDLPLKMDNDAIQRLEQTFDALFKSTDAEYAEICHQFSALGGLPRTWLIYGDSGAGKTHMVESFRKQYGVEFSLTITVGELATLHPGEMAKGLRTMLHSVSSCPQPVVVVLDNIDLLFPRDDADLSLAFEFQSWVQDMAELSNSRNQGRTLVLGLTTHASSVDPSILSCFEESVEMDVPTPLERQRILETSMAEYHSILQGKGAQRSKGSFEQETGNPSHHKLTVIENISMHCHGYLASDLDKLYRQALTRCGQQGKRLDEVSVEDFEDAMSSIQISSLRRNTGVQKTEQVSWNDIGGLEEVKRSLQESVIWIYQHADAYSRMGITPSKGVLLHGPPGTGKTLLAKAVATESKANFMAVSLPELIKGEVGESEKAISKIFQIAARCSPCIVFLDEVEAVFGNRESSGGLGKQLVSQILLEMDNCEKGVVFLAATNHPEAIDPSLLRAGRLDKLIHVPPPATEERMKILEILKRATRVSDSVDMKVIAEFTVGASGADLGALVRNAGHYALRAGRSEVTLQDFIDARLGSSRLHAF